MLVLTVQINMEGYSSDITIVDTTYTVRCFDFAPTDVVEPDLTLVWIREIGDGDHIFEDNEMISIKFEASDINGISSLQVYLDDNLLFQYEGAGPHTESFGPLNPASHTLRINAIDNLDHLNTLSLTIHVNIQTETVPIPTLVSVDYPDSINAGEWATITITARNDGATAEWQTIHCGFPDNPPLGNIEIVSHDLTNAEPYPTGTVLPANYGENNITSTYVMVEGVHGPWENGETHSMTVRVKPENTGTFTFYVKTVSRAEGVTYYDPTPEIKDQQDEYVYVHEIDVPTQKVTITGHFYYFDNQSKLRPVDRALVRLYDDDVVLDELLDSTYTASDGYFVLGPVENVDEEVGESGTRDLYITVYAENLAGKVRESPFILVPYEFRTATVWDVLDGDHDWGGMPVPEEQYPVFFILDAITLGYDYANTFVNSFSASVDVVWYEGYEGPLSQGTNYHPPTDTIHISGEIHNPDQWDDGVILHEYGHFVADKLDTMAWYNVTGEHEWNGTYSPQLAWSEGWAHFFSCAARESPSYRNTFPYDIWAEFDLETGTLTDDLGKTIDANALGGSCEASVAGILWDIFDSVDDDQNNDGVGDDLDYKEDQIWDVVLNYATGGMFSHKVYTIFDFWDGWFARGHEQRQKIWDIYYEHGETMPAAESTLTFNFSIGEETYYITTSSNSTVTDFHFSPVEGAFIMFNVTGPTGTVGYSSVTFPDDLVWGEFLVYFDGSPLLEGVDYSQIYNSTHYIFQITYTHTTHTIEIRGTGVISEFLPFLILPLFMTATLLAVIVYRRKNSMQC